MLQSVMPDINGECVISERHSCWAEKTDISVPVSLKEISLLDVTSSAKMVAKVLVERNIKIVINTRYL